MNVKTAFIEDIIEDNNVIQDTQQFYQVERFVMVTMKLLGNIIICDDTKSVGIIDSITMKKIN